MWNNISEEDKKTIAPLSYVSESGHYEMSIIRAELVQGSNGSQSAGIKLVVEINKKEHKLKPVWFRKKDGTYNDYAVRLLKHFFMLCGIDGEIAMKSVKDISDNGRHFKVFNMFAGVQCGAILKAVSELSSDGSKSYINLEIVDFTKNCLTLSDRESGKTGEAEKIASGLKPVYGIVNTGTSSATENTMIPRGSYNDEDDLPF